jgi:hypothetical protein
VAKRLQSTQVILPWYDHDGTRNMDKLKFDAGTGTIDRRRLKRELRKYVWKRMHRKLDNMQLNKLISGYSFPLYA